MKKNHTKQKQGKGSRLRTWKVEVTTRYKRRLVRVAELKRIAMETLSLVEREIALDWVNHLHILIVADDAIQEINRTYRKKDKPTDVLSFPSFEPRQVQGRARVVDVFQNSLGDLVISTDTTLRQAKEFQVTVESEVVRLVVHGILHLCGYDHEGVPRREAQRMRRKEQRIRRIVLSAHATDARKKSGKRTTGRKT